MWVDIDYFCIMSMYLYFVYEFIVFIVWYKVLGGYRV